MQLLWSGLFSSPVKLGLCISHLYFSFLWSYEFPLYKLSMVDRWIMYGELAHLQGKYATSFDILRVIYVICI